MTIGFLARVPGIISVASGWLDAGEFAIQPAPVYAGPFPRMSKHRRRRQRLAEPSATAGAQSAGKPAKDNEASAGWTTAQMRKMSAVRFLVLFAASVFAYFFLTATIRSGEPNLAEKHPIAAQLAAINERVQNHVLRPYQRLIAACAASAINFLGYEVTAEERTIRSHRFSVSIADGCDAVEVSLLLAVAIVTFPARARWKLVGLILGLAAIALLNLIRILTLWLIGVHWRAVFDFVHFSLWPFVFICFTLVLFVAWLRRARVAFPFRTLDSAATSQR